MSNNITTIATLLSGGEGVGVGTRAAGLSHLWGIEIAIMDDMWYTIDAQTNYGAFCFLTPAGQQPHIKRYGQSAPCVSDVSRPAVRLSNDRQIHRGRFAIMPRKSEVQHSFQGSIEGKECLSCQKWLPLSEYNIDRSKRDELNIYCKSCRKEKRAAKADEFNAKRRQLYAGFPEETRQRNKVWRKANCEAINQRRKEKYAANPEKYRKQAREFYRKNQKRIVEATRLKRAKDPFKHRQWSLRWTRENPEQRRVQSQKRRTLLSNTNGSYTVDEWNDLKAYYKFRCLGCKRQEPEIKLTVDHVIPLSKSGANTINNIQPLCLQCNSGKKDKIIDYRLPRREKS